MTVIPQKELRNNVSSVLRRAEAGEHFTITVSGRPVAELGPAQPRRWVRIEQVDDLWSTPPDATLMDDLAAISGGIPDPWQG
jgi:prevent-host-death family protein